MLLIKFTKHKATSNLRSREKERKKKGRGRAKGRQRSLLGLPKNVKTQELLGLWGGGFILFILEGNAMDWVGVNNLSAQKVTVYL